MHVKDKNWSYFSTLLQSPSYLNFFTIYSDARHFFSLDWFPGDIPNLNIAILTRRAKCRIVHPAHASDL